MDEIERYFKRISQIAIEQNVEVKKARIGEAKKTSVEEINTGENDEEKEAITLGKTLVASKKWRWRGWDWSGEWSAATSDTGAGSRGSWSRVCWVTRKLAMATAGDAVRKQRNYSLTSSVLLAVVGRGLVVVE
ncbi:hypothetical protein Fot_34602 [Forsythia ovata]|uniref:Uncharacterized protein n=1 Tax=Forsythia ovata TaxID=205694 RepID=A0ABD1SM19_9LAMI